MSHRRPQIWSFNSRPSCEGRQDTRKRWVLFDVSIHAPRVRGDLTDIYTSKDGKFQFTPLV